MTEGSMTEGATTEGAMTEGSMTEGAPTDDATTEGATTEGAMTETSCTLAGACDGTPPAAASATRTAGAEQDEAMAHVVLRPQPAAAGWIELAYSTVSCAISYSTLPAEIVWGGITAALSRHPTQSGLGLTTRAHPRMHARTHSRVHAHMHECVHVHAYARTHARHRGIHRHAHARMREHACTHMLTHTAHVAHMSNRTKLCHMHTHDGSGRFHADCATRPTEACRVEPTSMAMAWCRGGGCTRARRAVHERGRRC